MTLELARRPRPTRPLPRLDLRALPLARPSVLWFTGLSGAGKSTLAGLVHDALREQGSACCRIDGDQVREGLCSDLGFSAEDRLENVRRVAHVARMMADAGLIVLVSMISPLAAMRAHARHLVEGAVVTPGDWMRPDAAQTGEMDGTPHTPAPRFVEVHVDAPLAIVEQRDTKGLYARARRGDLPNFTGVQAPYEAPASPDLHLHTDMATPEHTRDVVLQWLRQEGLIE